MNTLTDTLGKAFDVAEFRETGHQLVDQIADHLANSIPAREGKVLPWEEPETLLSAWSRDLQEPGPAPMSDFFGNLLSTSMNGHHPHYLGHQVTPPAPMAVLAEFLGAYINNGSGIFEVGSHTTVFERQITDLVCQLAGFGPESGGFLTSGGSLGNLTALLAARQAKGGGDIWDQGTTDSYAVLVSEEAHYSIDRMVRILGWGSEGLVKVPTDADYRLDSGQLDQALAEAHARGRKVIAVVGNAGSTATGSFDPLDEIADFCKANDLWFHVDGAHGGSVIFSKQHRHLLKGLDRADSFILDFHKMLLVPALATALVFRQADHSYSTFAQRAQYLWQDQSEQEWYNLAKRTFECTKPILSLKVYSLLQAYGTRLFEEAIDNSFAQAKQMARMLEGAADFELLAEPSANILCYRYVPVGYEGDLNELNSRIRQSLMKAGDFYIVQTLIGEEVYLRSAIMNPFSNESDFERLLTAIRGNR